jgi:hypothetical protein
VKHERLNITANSDYYTVLRETADEVLLETTVKLDHFNEKGESSSITHSSKLFV